MSKAQSIDIKELHEFEGGQNGWYAKGHHPADEFLDEVERLRTKAGVGTDYTLEPSYVRHELWRIVPHRYDEERYVGIITRARAPGRGAFPVTVYDG